MDADATVRELLARGEHRAAADAALRAVGPAVLGYLRAMLRDEADAADAFSGFAEALLRGLPSFRGASSLKTWAIRLAIHEAYDVRADAWRRRVRRLASREASALADDVRRSSVLVAEHRRRELDRLRGELSARDRTLLVLRVDQGLSWPEIAEVLAASGEPASPVAASKRFDRLKEKLRTLAERDGLLD